MRYIYTAVLLAAAPLTQAAYRAQTQPADVSHPPGHYASIELRARNANVRDRQSIQDLAHAVIAEPHYCRLPDSINELLETKVTDAEINFRDHTGHGVSETQIVDLMNWMGDRFHMPAYTSTTGQQVRSVRMRLAIMAPSLMGNTLSGKEIAKGGHVRTEMSPLQALHLLNVLIDQKIINPDYQDPSVDAVAAERERDKASGAAMGNKRVGSTTGGNARSISISTNPKEKEVRDAISAAQSAMTMQDAYDVVNHALKTLQLD